MPSYGRGGAGNIQAVEQANTKISSDLEANKAAAGSHDEEQLSSHLFESEQQQYVHTGRGGVGNYASSKDLKDISTITNSNATAQVVSHSARTSGRGGAGNYAFGTSQIGEREARNRIHDEQRRERLKHDIEKGVKESLAMPQKAKLLGHEP